MRRRALYRAIKVRTWLKLLSIDIKITYYHWKLARLDSTQLFADPPPLEEEEEA